MKHPLKHANRNLIIMVIIAIIIATSVANAQIHFQDEDRYSIHLATDNVIFQKGIFYGGVEFQAEFSNGIYIRPQAHYCALKDGYLETSAGLGLNLSLNRWNTINVYSGIKLGVINRAASYPIFGFEAGIEFNITDKIGLGLRGSYDARGDSDFYGGNKWIYNSQGYIKFIL